MRKIGAVARGTLTKLVATSMLAVGALQSVDSRAYTIDPSTTAISGLWWNASQSGWGVALTHQYNVIFVTLYTYDASGNPVWYVASSCAVVTDRCTGALYRVNGGTPLTSAWTGGVGVTEVGSVTIIFTDVNTASMSYTLNGAASTRAITRQVFASAPVVTDARALTLQMVGSWEVYTADQQTLYGRYSFLSTTAPIQGTNGWFINGTIGFQAGYNTTLAKHYIIDVVKESGFVQEYHFDAAVGTPTTGCRYRYPLVSSDKGVCTRLWASHR